MATQERPWLLRPYPPEKPLLAARCMRRRENPALADCTCEMPLDGERRRLGPQRCVLQRAGRGVVGGIVEVEGIGIANRAQHVWIGEAHGRVLGRKPGHADGTFRHFAQRVGTGVRGRDAGLPLSHHDAQADLDALGAFGLFQPTVQHVHR
jgi:hypothetical protein